MWNYTVAWCIVTEQQAKKSYLKCYEVYTTFTDQQETSAAESCNAAMYQLWLNYITDRYWFKSE